MNRYFQIEFSGGGKFQAELLETEAPKTSEMFWSALPFEGKIVHGSFTGFTLFSFVDFKVGKVENPFIIGDQPGYLFLNTYANEGLFDGKQLHEEIIIPYLNGGIFWNWGGLLPSNLFAKINENIEQLYPIGRRIQEHGAEIIRYSKLLS
jgi:hypothetical protein